MSTKGRFKVWKSSAFIFKLCKSITPEKIEKLVLEVSISTILDKNLSNIKFRMLEVIYLFLVNEKK